VISVQLATHFSFSLGRKTRDNPANTSKRKHSFDWALFIFHSNPPSCHQPHEHTKTEAAEARVSKRQRGIPSSDLSDGPWQLSSRLPENTIN